jgi:hypothetical protein
VLTRQRHKERYSSALGYVALPGVFWLAFRWLGESSLPLHPLAGRPPRLSLMSMEQADEKSGAD